MIVIVDYGMGNLGSIHNMFKRIGVESSISSSPEEIGHADKLLLPGVGSFDSAITRIQDSGLREILDRKAMVDCIPILGICLGMQLLTRSSEEGQLSGLGWISAQTRRFPVQEGLKVPHMGWNFVFPSKTNRLTQKTNRLTQDLPQESRYYFVHSYYVSVDKPEDSILRTTYGIEFDSAIHHGNIYGTQFHPEKSHKFGMQLLSNFARL